MANKKKTRSRGRTFNGDLFDDIVVEDVDPEDGDRSNGGDFDFIILFVLKLFFRVGEHGIALDRGRRQGEQTTPWTAQVKSTKCC